MKSYRRRETMIILAGFVGLFSLIILYYTTHKPFSVDQFASLLKIVWRLLLPALLILAAGGLGSRLWPAGNLPARVRFSLQAFLGLGLLSLIFLILASFIGTSVWLFAGLLVLVLIVFHRNIILWIKQISDFGTIFSEIGWVEKTLAFLCGLMLLSTLIVALAPPLAYDAQMYHLVMPQAYLSQGQVDYLPWLAMTGMPQIVEMLFTWVIGLGGYETAAVLGWMAAFLAISGLLGFLSWRWDKLSAWVGISALLGGYSMVTAISSACVDWWSLSFGLCAFIMLDCWREKTQQNDLIISGLFVGFAAGTKYTAGAVGLVCLMVIIWSIFRLKLPFFSTLIPFALPAVAAFSPWFIRNLIYTGNPLYPFFFVSGEMTAASVKVYQSLPPWGNWLDLIALPFRSTVMGIDSAEGYSFSIGPLLVGLGILAGTGRGRRSPVQQSSFETAAVFSICGWLTMAIANQFSGFLIQTRLFLSLFPGFTVLAAAGWWGLTQIKIMNLNIKFVAGGLIIFVIAINTFETGLDMIKKGSIRQLMGLSSPETYLQDNLGWLMIAEESLESLPGDGRVLLLYEPRSLYCAPRCAPDEILDQWQNSQSEHVDNQAIVSDWIAQGFRYLLVNKAGVDFLRENPDPHHPIEELNSLEKILSELTIRSTFGDSYVLYDLEE